jgi:hypothetical protein
MDELRKAVLALSDEVRSLERQIVGCGDVPAKAQLQSLQHSIDRMQQGLNRLQTAMDVWSEETEEV